MELPPNVMPLEEVALEFPFEYPEGACDNEDSDFICTLDAPHHEPHEAHDIDDHVVATWYSK